MIVRGGNSFFKSQISVSSESSDRKLSCSVSRRVSKIRQQKYVQNLDQIHMKNWQEFKNNQDKIKMLQKKQEILQAVIQNQSQQLKKTQLQLLKEEFKLQIQRLSEQIRKLHAIREQVDDDMIKAKEDYQLSYQNESMRNLRFKESLEKSLAEIAHYRSILESNKLAVKLSEIKIAENTIKINKKIQIEAQFKKVMAKNESL